METQRWIAFLRAINVGGHTVKMDNLRSLFATLGFTAIETFIASGNVIFDAPATQAADLEQQIQHHLQQALGYEVATFIRTPLELAAVAAYQPFLLDNPDAKANLYIAFLQASPKSEAQQKLFTYCSLIDDFHVQGREVYWLCRKTMSESVFSGALMEKALGMPATMRNITTIRKMAAKYSETI